MDSASKAASGPPRRRRRSSPALAIAAIFIGLAVAVAGGLWTDRFAPLPNPLEPVTGARWWITPVERNAFMRLPVVQGQLLDVHALAGSDVVWAVGRQGLLVGTRDGGQTWTRGEITGGNGAGEDVGTGEPEQTESATQAGRPLASLSLIRSAVAAVPTPPVLNVEGGTNTDATYENEAAKEPPRQQEAPPVQQSVEQSSPSEPEKRTPRPDISSGSPGVGEVEPPPIERALQDLRAVLFVSPDVGVAVGHNGTVLRTSDGGARWVVIDSGTAFDLQDVATTGGRLIVVGDGGVILTSDDQGRTWSSRSRIARTASLRAIAFTRGTRAGGTGVAIGDRVVLRTEDGGNSWTPLPQDMSGVQDLAFADATTGVAVGSNGLFTTSDSGRTWTRHPQIEASNLRAVVFLDDRRGVALGDEAQVLRTNDAGRNWALESLPTGLSLSAATVSEGRLHATGGGEIVSSADGGRQWSTLATDSERLFLALGFADARAGAAVGAGGTTWWTDDGGVSWQPAQRRTSANLEFLHFAQDGRGIAVGEEAELQVTSDGGRTWTPEPSAPQQPRNTYVDLMQRMAAASPGNPAGFNGPVWQAGPVNRAGVFASLLEDVAQSLAGIPAFPIAMATDDGRVSFSRDSGATWQYFESTPEPWRSASAVAFNDSGSGVLVGRNGLFMSSSDGGRNWTARDGGTTLHMKDVAFLTRDRVVAAGGGRILASDDAGATWATVEYGRYPSPWLWVAAAILLSAIVWLTRARARSPAVMEPQVSVADAAVSDSPIGWNDPDALGLRDIALGLSRFLRNRRTQPPLTIAVTGEWGTGKSSLMNLLRVDLRRYGFRPVWFNAWHHQSGENLLGSLLANIHAQAVPPWHTLAGIDFRLSLLLVRIRRFWLRLAITLFLLATVFFCYPLLGESISDLLRASADASDESAWKKLGTATGLLGVLATLVAPVIGAIRAVSAFGLQPGKLIAAVATTRTDESARQQAGARYRFAREFDDFSKALDPRTLVIFIDDLDRCRPENVIEVLEAVNFLVASGRCVVVLGMARRWVEACVGQAFKELAAADSIGRARPATREESSEDRNEEQRLFARNYLEKLINIEIRIPRPTEDASHAILQSGSAEPVYDSRRRAVGQALLQAAPVAALAAAVAIVVGAGWMLAQWLNDVAAMQASLSASQVARTAEADPGPGNIVPNEPVSPGAAPAVDAGAVAFAPPSASPSARWYLGTGVPVLLGILALAGVLLFARKEVRTDDSPAFLAALRIFQPWIVLGGQSPRSLKRFCNHLRYVAMRFRRDVERPSTWERARQRVAAWFDFVDPEADRQPPSNRIALEEHVLVALASIYRCNETWLDELVPLREGRIEHLLERDFADRVPDRNERARIAATLTRSLQEFNREFPAARLFDGEVLDRRRIVAFYDVMAAESEVREPTPASGEVAQIAG